MAIIASTISGGFEDPDATGLEPPGSTLNAVYEYSDFVDKIEVTLTTTPPAPVYTAINNLSCIVSVFGSPVTQNEITNNNAANLNITYNSPNTNSVSGLNVIVSIENSNTTGNIYITGNIQNAFPDKYWEYIDLKTKSESIVDSTTDIPDSDVVLFTHKPSFLRYVNINFNVTVGYAEGIVTSTIPKKVVNDWDINRLAIISQVNRENAYRSNNYPKDY